jgi:hypothetical protein
MSEAWRRGREMLNARVIRKLTACMVILAICSCAKEDVRPKIKWMMADRRNEIPPYSGHAARLDAVPRAIVKEPTYRTKPGYCLLVFGSADKTPIWLVEDGDILYVDRNGDGDLTEPGKAVRAGGPHRFTTLADGRLVPYRDLKYRIGSIGPTGGNQHAEFEVIRAQQGHDAPIYVISGMVNGTSKQYAGWGLSLAPSRDTAPILHFGGLLLPEAVRVDRLKIGKPDQELHVRFYTPGVGRSSTVSLGNEAVPPNIHPIGEITWPGGSVPPKSVVSLSERC